MADCSCCEKFSSCIQSESPQKQFMSIIPCLLYVTPCKKGVASRMSPSGPSYHCIKLLELSASSKQLKEYEKLV